MKVNLPLAAGAALVAAGLGVLVLWKPDPPPRELAAPSLERLRGELRDNPDFRGFVEGRDYVIDTPVILRRTDEDMLVRLVIRFPNREPGMQYHRYAMGDRGWTFDRDLGASFREFVERESKPASERLAKRLAERYQDAVNIPAENVRIAHRLRETPADPSKEVRIIGMLDIRFRDGGGEGRYVEDFAFEGGKWVLQGQTGQLFDRGPTR